jgi:membrane protein implicated in regulation of membrane protease activity
VTEFFASVPPLWFWLCLAGVLLALELMSGSAFFLCLSTAALIAAGAAFAGLSLARSSLLFALLLIPASFFWRTFLRPRRKIARENILNARDKRLIGTVAILTEDSAGCRGRLRVADASWPYECDRPLKKGEAVIVREAKGIILRVAPYRREEENPEERGNPEERERGNPEKG